MKTIFIFLFPLIAFTQKYEATKINEADYVIQKDTSLLKKDSMIVFIETKIPIEKFKDDFIKRVFFLQSKITSKETEIAKNQKDIDALKYELMMLKDQAGIIIDSLDKEKTD